ncbi:MAG: hypothetical protein ACRD2N_01585 [Vicinamibacterales bacterium]
MRTQLSWLATAGALSLVVTSCTGSPQSPTSPSAAAGGTTFERNDPATLKVDAPKVVSPTDNELLDTRRPNLLWVNPTGKYAGIGLAYEIELRDATDKVVYTVTVGETPDLGSHIVPFELDVDKAYFWQVRGRLGDMFGPWSITGDFRTPKPTATNAPAPGPTGPSDGTVGPARRIDFNEAWNIIVTIHNVGGFDLGSRSTRDGRIAFLNGAVAAIHFGHPRWNPQGPDNNWCVKDAGGGRPQSDDVIVNCRTRDAWDLVAGAGANGYSFHRDYLGILPSVQNVYPPPFGALNNIPR